jgi:hypothetical protein
MGVSEYGAYLDGAGSEVLSVVEVEIGYFLEI